MRQFLLATTAAVAFGGTAFASDLPPRVPAKAAMAYAAAPHSWTGCYIGAHAGAGWSHTQFSDPNSSGFTTIAPPGGAIDLDSNASFIGGGQLGCDYQFASNWVVGAAGDFSWANIEGHETDPFFSGKSGNPITLHARTDFLASATGRLGYAWDHYLLYAKGGAAWAHDKYTVNNLTEINFSFCFTGGFVACNPTGSATRFGWTAGAGFEWAFTNNWSVLAEFDYYDFGTKSISLSDPNSGNGPALLDVKQNIAVAKLGLNYRFGWGH
jgi:outer membrane immunogenic protein